MDTKIPVQIQQGAGTWGEGRGWLIAPHIGVGLGPTDRPAWFPMVLLTTLDHLSVVTKYFLKRYCGYKHLMIRTNKPNDSGNKSIFAFLD